MGRASAATEWVNWIFLISGGVHVGIYQSVVQGLVAYIEKPSDAYHKWRRTKAMASTEVSDGSSYQAALRWAMGCRFCKEWEARVVQEKRPSRTGAVRAMSRSDHWRWASAPKWVRTLYVVVASLHLNR